MARSILLAFAIAWLVAGAAGLGLAALGVEALERSLPPLAIDTDALRATVLAVAVAVLLIGAIHVLILLGMRARHRLAWTAGILFAGLLSATSLALSVASATSASVDAPRALAYVLAAIGALAGAACYALVVARLIREVRAMAAG